MPKGDKVKEPEPEPEPDKEEEFGSNDEISMLTVDDPGTLPARGFEGYEGVSRAGEGESPSAPSPDISERVRKFDKTDGAANPTQDLGPPKPVARHVHAVAAPAAPAAYDSSLRTSGNSAFKVARYKNKRKSKRKKRRKRKTKKKSKRKTKNKK
jgi:hypothetical protein